MKKDWQTDKHICFMALLLILTTAIVGVYYFNYPFVETNADTPSYLQVTQQILTTGNPVDVFRMPSYPFMVLVIYLVAGMGNLMAVSIVQGFLFILATLEIYILAVLLFRRTWLAFLVGLLVGSNVILISYIKPIMTEGPSLWLLTTIILLSVLLLRFKRHYLFWGIAALMLILIFTRPEWIFLPVLLYSYYFLSLRGQKILRYLLPRMLLSLTVIYILIGSYIAANTVQNHYVGLTTVQNMNLIGKMLQYQMQDEAPPQYRSISARFDPYAARHIVSPYYIFGKEPDLGTNHGAVPAKIARTIFLHHPLEFLLKSVPYFFSSLTDYYPMGIMEKRPVGPFDPLLSFLLKIERRLYEWNLLFPYCVLLWLVLLCWKRTRRLPKVQAMGLIVLVVIYAIIITTLGGYQPTDYMRVHIIFDPLIMLTIWGTLLYGLIWGIQIMRKRLQRHYVPGVE